MKYIIVNQHDLEMAILFDEIISHDFVAAGRKVVSAGMVTLQDGKPSAYGSSFTLRLNSRPQDSEIIKQSLERTI
jgi:hypothetical protein